MSTLLPGRVEGAPRAGPCVGRRRVLDALHRIKPSGVVLSAPSGYGKSVLAGQFAAGKHFERVVWAECYGVPLSDAELFKLVAARIEADGSTPPDMKDVAGEAGDGVDWISSIARAFRMGKVPAASCVVLDDLHIDSTREAVWSLLEVFERSLESAALIVTTRCKLREPPYLSRNIITIGPAELRFDVDEAREVLDLIVGTGRDRRADDTIIKQCNGHAGLLACVSRRASLGVAGLSASPDDVYTLCRAMALDQLDAAQRELLYALSLAGTLSLSEARQIGVACDPQTIERLAECLPPIEWRRSGGDRDGESLIAPDFVQRACQNNRFVDSLLDNRAHEVRRALVVVLEARGEYDRVLNLVDDEPDQAMLRSWLERAGKAAADAGLRGRVRSVIDRIPPEELLRAPRLLLLRADLDLGTRANSDRIAAMRAAGELAYCEHDMATYVAALLLGARDRMHAGDIATAIEILTTLKGLPDTVLDAGTCAQVNGYLLTQYALRLETERVEELRAEAMELCREGRVAPEDEIHLMARRGIASFVLNEFTEARADLRPAYYRAGVSLVEHAKVAGFYAAVLAQLGSTAHARRIAHDAVDLSARSGLEVCRAMCHAVSASIEFGASGSASCLAEIQDSVRSLAESGDYVTEALLRTQLATMYRAAAMLPEAVAEVERVLHTPATRELASVRHLAEVEHVANLIALGDLDEARILASMISQTGAGHALVRADLLLAEISRREAALEDVAGSLSRHAGYLLSGNANWIAGMYTRAFPHMIGVIARAVTPERLPARMLRLAGDSNMDDVLTAAREILGESEWRALASRAHSLAVGDPKAGTITTVSPCSVRLFGGLEVVVGRRKVAERAWEKRKGRVLFAKLVLEQGKEIPREYIYECLWPEMEIDRARNNFYVVWSSMKAALSPGIGKDNRCPYVSSSGGLCRIDPDVVHSDVREFDEAHSQARAASKQGDTERALAAYEKLAELYRGDILPGDVYVDWFGEFRDRYRHEFADAMLDAGSLLVSSGDVAGALRLMRKAVQVDPWREDLYQGILKAQIVAGQRSAAVETYQVCRDRLSEDLGLDPSVETQRLYAHVLAMDGRACIDGR